MPREYDYDEGRSIMSPSDDQQILTPNDNEDLATYPKAIIANGTGTIKARGRSSAADVTYNVNTGQLLPIRIRRLYSTGTNVSVIGLF